MTGQNRDSQIIERLFFSRYQSGMREVSFEREDIVRVAAELGIKLPKNLGDVVYSFRYRATLPQAIRDTAAEGEAWIIRPAGRARYSLALVTETPIVPNLMLAETKVPDATPGIVTKYALNDEQGLLAKLRYNRLIDIFMGVTCYSLHNHLRTTVPYIGQVETDEIYVGVDRRGAHYVFPVQAKGGKDKLSIVQIEQDYALCAHKFPALICRPIAAQFIGSDLIALFAFEESANGLAISSEKHYRLVPPDEVSVADLETDQARPF
jgi:hypothetical protein